MPYVSPLLSGAYALRTHVLTLRKGLTYRNYHSLGCLWIIKIIAFSNRYSILTNFSNGTEDMNKAILFIKDIESPHGSLAQNSTHWNSFLVIHPWNNFHEYDFRSKKLIFILY